MSAIKRENGGASAGNAAANSQTSTSEAQDKARSARKRTKTGCLTCRKRRIKCDEGKPICKNCQKSKRQCEGYNQRVVFKPADFQYLPHGGATITFDAGMVQDARGDTGDNNQSAAYPQRTAPQPRSLSVASQIHQPYQTLGDSLEQSQSPPLSQSRTYDASLHGMQQPVVSHFQQSPPLAGMPFSDHHASFQNSGQRDRNSQNPALLRTIPGRDSSYITQQFPPDEWQQNEQNEFGTVQWSSNLVPGDQVSPVSSQAWHERNTGYVSPPQRIPSIQHDYPMFDYETNMGRPQPMDHRKLSRAHSDCTNTYGGNTNTVRVDNDFTTPETLHPELGDTAHLDSAAIEIHDDDYYDVDTEDEMYDMDNEFDAQDLQEQRQCGYDQRNPSGYSLSASKMDARNFDSFVFSGILDTYRPEQVANPLKNPATARVFAHFVSETAAVLTTSPRQTWKANAFAGNKSFPMSKHCIWTYDMPMAALHHQALLQSMLAISSLQIAKVQGASETPSLKHYAYALKRIHHCVGNLKKRLSVPTLAASLLLGYYEVMAANHANWQSHLTGARQLMVEIDFAGMTKMFKRMKFDKAKTDQRLPRYQSSSIPQLPDDQSPEDLILDQMYEADENVVSRICGIRVSYARYGHVGEGNVAPQSSNLERYDALRDLYWWYCKQDVYHSLISGDPLMMDYSRFTDCPPRASLSKADALYGSFDHLVLLLARIADFASKDRKRKIKASHIAGSSPSTQARSTSGPRSSASPNQHSVSPTHMPYPPGVSHSPASTTSHDFADLGAATANALQEWESIRDALNFFVSSLGPHFQPLDAEFQQSVPTPYGLAVFYRSWDLSVFWTVYNMAMIAAHRFHPHMPPAAHVAAAAAAEQTREHALQIGRIAAGIMLPPPESPLDPRMGAAMVDMVVPLFFAGVQYTQPDHRQWHVERLFETNRRVGWATAGIIAEGCQSGWIRAAEAGRGPPHVRVRKATFSDFRIGRYGDWSAVEKNRLSELDAENDRKFVRTKASARVHWAIGLMGTEEDVNEDSE